MMTEHGVKDLFFKDLHQAAAAKFVVFANTNMPIFYPLGIVKEHLHTRKHAGLFDVSHMKQLLVQGEKSSQLLGRCLPLDTLSMATGRCQYSFLLNDNAGIIDDLIVTKLADNAYLLTVNAANWEMDLEAVLEANDHSPDVSVQVLERVILALQGPESAKVMRDIGFAQAAQLDFMSAYQPRENWLIARSGYTGEDGFEISMPHSDAKLFAQKLTQMPEVEWIGLAARDSLRLEAGLCLHGQDITAETSPVEAGLLWAVSKTIRAQGEFRGADALRNLINVKPDTTRCGFAVQGRQPVRAGATLVNEAGEIVGSITSGGFGPSVDAAIAMGYLKKDCLAKQELIFAQQRGKNIELHPQKLPFVAHNYYK